MDFKPKNALLEGLGFVYISSQQPMKRDFRNGFTFGRTPLGEVPLTYAVDVGNNLWVHWGKHIDLSKEGFHKIDSM